MRIFAAHIEHFRCLGDFWFFPNRTINIIVGSNNCGKTALLTAIGLVLDPSINWRPENHVSIFDFSGVDTSKPVQITVWLECGDISNNVFGDRLSLWQKIPPNYDSDARELSNSRETERLKPVTISPMDEPESDFMYKEFLALRLKFTYDVSTGSIRAEHGIMDEMGSFRSLTRKERECIGFFFSPTNRDPISQLSLSRHSLLSKHINSDEIASLLNELLRILEGNIDAIEAFPTIRSLLSSLKYACELDMFLSGKGEDSVGFALTFLDSDPGRLRSALSIATKAGVGRQRIPLKYQGHGFQNMVLLLTLLHLMTSPDSSLSILVVEEPEQNLEPVLAKWLMRRICQVGELVSNGDTVGSARQIAPQVFITTHSPALVSEIHGADSIIRMIARPSGSRYCTYFSRLDPPMRKTLERNRSRYSDALFAKQAMIVEGDSEVGLLPVVFSGLSLLSSNTEQTVVDPCMLGVAMVKGDSNTEALKHAAYLEAYGVETHILLDYDAPQKGGKTWDEVVENARKVGTFVTSWPKCDLLPFAKGCDLETMLVDQTPPTVLLEAIRLCYEDAGHELKAGDWEQAKKQVIDEDIQARLNEIHPEREFPSPEVFGDETVFKAALLALLHGPHSCKAVKDMRMIAEYLVEKKAIPQIFLKLQKRICECLVQRKGAKKYVYLPRPDVTIAP